MSYVKKTWVTGEVVYAGPLNNIENGIANNDAAITGLTEELATKANTDGYYQDMTVGNAEQLVSSVYVEDSEPYNFRTSGGSADIGTREYDEIVGLSVGWNQLNKNDAASGSGQGGSGITFTNNEDGSWTVSGTFSSRVYKYLGTSPTSGSPMAPDHVILVTCDELPQGVVIPVGFYKDTTYKGQLQVTRPFSLLGGKIGKTPAETNIIYQPAIDLTNSVGEGTVVNFTQHIGVYDLTLTLGSTIADYVYSLEQATAGAGIAWLKTHFSKMFGAYQPYDAGSIQSVTGMSAHKMTGFNQYDKTAVTAGKWISDSAKGTLANNAAYSVTDYIPVIPGLTYYVGATGSARNTFFDQNKVGIGQFSHNAAGTATIPANAYYIRCTLLNENVDGFCINLSWDGSRNGEYEPYKEWTYPLDDSLTLRGILKLDANNAPYADGDFYEADGTVTRRFGEKTFDGSEDWAASSQAQNVYYLALNTTTFPQLNDPSLQMVSNRYQYVGTGTNSTFLNNYSEGVGAWANTANPTATQRYFYVKDSSISSVADFKASLAANPLTVVFTLQNEGMETAEPYQSPQVVDDFGTEEYISTSIVPVGHNTKYQNNLVAKLEMAPESPSGAGDYIVRQTGGENSYVPVSDNSTISVLLSRCPACPADTDGSYVLKATVSGGAVSYAWEVES